MHTNNYPTAPLPQLSESNLPIFGVHERAKRVYQAWKGNNRFFFGGRLIFGPDVRSLFLTILLIVVPAFLFCAFISKEVIKDCQHDECIIVPATSTIFTVYIIILLFLTSSRDPGIIPRNTHPPELEDEAETSSLPSDWIANHGMFSSIPPTKDVVVNGIVLKVKFCHTCMLYRPPRCSHCSICNNCVERFDHHCPWVGQCIGKRNYRFFFMFVSSTTLFCLYVLACCCLNVRNIMKAHDCNIGKALHMSPVSGILIAYTFIGAWFVGGLTAFHIYLICTNQTTYENFRYKYNRKTNPHNIGLIRNIREIFFSSIPSSDIKFRAKLEYSPSSVATSLSISMGHHHRMNSLNMPTDAETGGKRQTVDAEEFAAIQNQLETVTSLERCGPQPRHNSNWEMMPEELGAFDAEFGKEQHGSTADRSKIG